MANIKKGFNFRNGVQVDDDNLKVSPTGLVGIGTTVPTEALDVRGNLVVTGISSSATVKAGVVTVTTLNPTEIIGAGVSIVSGIVTASSGIITFYGDARFLQGMPTSQWEDVNTGFGVTSIYNTGGNVGIATSNPQFTLQIGADVNSFKDGVGISSFGDIKASGIITATTFIGNISGTGATFTSIAGNVTGNVTGLVNSSGISTFGGINATGRIVGSATSNVIPFLYSNLSDLPSASTYHGAFAHVHSQGKGYFAHAGNWWELVNKQQDGTVGTGVENYVIDRLVSTSTTATSLNVAGVSTLTGSLIANGSVDFNGDLDVDGHTELDNTTITGVVTFTEAKTPSAGNTLAIGADKLILRNRDGNEQFLEANDNGSVKIYYDFLPRLETSGVGVTITSQLDTTNIVASGIITASTELNSPLIGVGTDAPANDIQVRKTGDVEIQVTSDTGVAGLTVGRESGVSNTNNAEFRYGLVSGGSPYSSAQSLDIINYGTDNFNYFLSGNNPGGANGDFHWHKGFNSTRLMTLTKDGNLGIGETQPITTLHIQGISTVTGSSFVGGTFDVGGNAIVGGNLTIGGDFNLSAGSFNGNVIGNVTGNLTGSVNNTGISTFANVAIGTYYAAAGVELDGSQITAVFNRVSVGSTDPESGADFKNCGAGVTDRFLIPPTVTTIERNSITTPVDGGLIFNSTSNRLEVYLQNSWVGIATVV